MDLRRLVRTIPDHPKPGILFRDITTLLSDPAGLREAVAQLAAPFAGQGIAQVAGIESRGFILGAPVAVALGTGFVPLRKAGRLPAATLATDYTLEYGADRLEIHADALRPGDRVLIVDDLLATGGTAGAAVRLVRMAGATVVACAFVIELPDLGGRSVLGEVAVDIHALVAFDGH
jgi:adenine phosphoribosyltransferase